jgi:hypothetical protein
MSTTTLSESDERLLRKIAITLYDLGGYSSSIGVDALCDEAEVVK